jgi:hypothetical protein
MLLYDKGPLSARELRTAGALLALMERQGMLEALPGGTYKNSMWTLTPKGRLETRRCRKAYNKWLKTGR